MKTVKTLRRVGSGGLYHCGPITVMRNPKVWYRARSRWTTTDKQRVWLAIYTDWMGAKVEEYFPTLAAVRAWLNR